jgi:hypothetical protein
MSDFKTRLTEEETELRKKHQDLRDFLGLVLFSNLPMAQQVLLRAQADVMNSYRNILHMRISLLED